MRSVWHCWYSNRRFPPDCCWLRDARRQEQGIGQNSAPCASLLASQRVRVCICESHSSQTSRRFVVFVLFCLVYKWWSSRREREKHSALPGGESARRWASSPLHRPLCITHLLFHPWTRIVCAYVCIECTTCQHFGGSFSFEAFILRHAALLISAVTQSFVRVQPVIYLASLQTLLFTTWLTLWEISMSISNNIYCSCHLLGGEKNKSFSNILSPRRREIFLSLNLSLLGDMGMRAASRLWCGIKSWSERCQKATIQYQVYKCCRSWMQKCR